MALNRRIAQLILLFFSVIEVNGIRNRFVTRLCPGSAGPSEGEVLRYDPQSDANPDTWVIPTTDLDCWITFRGIADVVGEPKRKISLVFRTNSFSMRGMGYGTGASNTADGGACDTAYIELFEATADGRYIESTRQGPYCGTIAPPDIISVEQSLVIHVYIEAPPIVTTDAFTTPFLVTADPSVTEGFVTTEVVTRDVTVPITVGDTTGNTTEPTPTLNPLDGPYVHFRADFTSYFDGDCSIDSVDDEDQLQCATGTRCIHKSLKCDSLGATNCEDRSDQSQGEPSYCGTPREEEEEPSMLPLWILLGLLGALLLLAILYWCCWRPGYCPWRLARVRNIGCCQGISRCCAGCCPPCGCCGPPGGCCRTACMCCHRTGSSYPERASGNDADTLVGGGGGGCLPCCKGRDSGSGGDPGAVYGADLQGEWNNYCKGDGCHVREMR